MKGIKSIYRRGSITVFISIVLSSIFLVAGTFTDAARIRLAHSQVQRAGQTALSSILACYNNELKDQYGLFGFFLDNETISDSFEEYFSKNLNMGSQDFLYGYNIEKITLEQPFSLGENKIFEEQIMEFMKYRAPAEIVSQLLSKIEGIKNLSKGSKAYKRKMETDKKAGAVGKLQMLLEEKANAINDTAIAVKIKALKEQLIEKNSVVEEVSARLKDLQGLYSNEKDASTRKSLLGEINSVRAELTDINNAKANIKRTILDNLNLFKNLNSEAAGYSQSITVQKSDLLVRIEEELNFVNDSQEGIEEIQKAYNQSLSDMRNIIGEDNSESIIRSLESNILSCRNALEKSDGNEEGFLAALDLFQSQQINYTFNKSDPASSDDEDNREKVLQVLQKAFNLKGEMKTIDHNLLKQLPSRKRMLQEENSHWNITDFNTTNGAEKELQYIAEKENGFEQIALNIAEELFVNEYIMGIFRHDVPLLKGETDCEAYNLRSQDKYQRDGFFSCYEVEYIINGNKDEAVNAMLIKSEILAVRLAANVIHIYTDPFKMNRVTGLAAALSSWNAGLSTPLIQTMLIFSWAMFESLYDQEQLSQGEKISLYKTKEQWKTDISGAINNKKTVEADNNPLLLSYQDYLRIFLLLTDKEKKLARTQDLIQLNVAMSTLDFSMENTHVALVADTMVSMKNFFLTIPAFSLKEKRNISRTNINESTLLSY